MPLLTGASPVVVTARRLLVSERSYPNQPFSHTPLGTVEPRCALLRGGIVTTTRQWRNLAPWAVIGMLLLAFALRTYALGKRELTFDEVGSVFIAARGPLGILAYLRDAIREHPPFYYLLLSLWMPLAGRSEFAVRFLSVAIGLVTVAAMYRLARQTMRQPAALLTTFLLVLSPFHVRVSQDARMYVLLALWSLLSIFLFVRLLSQDRFRWWGLFWLVTGLGMFTHYFMAFVLVAQDLFLLLNWRRYRHLWARWLAVHVVLGGIMVLWALLAPGLWATLVSLWSRGAASSMRWSAFFRALNGLYLGATLRPNWYHLGLPLILTALGLGLVQRRNLLLPRGHKHERVLLGLLLGVPLVAVLVLPERVTGRYLTAALPAVILVIGSAFGQFFAKPPGQVVEWPVGRLSLFIVNCSLFIGIIFVDISAYSPVYFPAGESFRARIEYLRARARPGDGLLLHGPWQKLLLFYYSAGPLQPYTIPLRDLKVEAELAAETLTEMFDTHDRVWVSYNSVDPVDPDWIVARWLHEHTHRVWSQGNLTLYRVAPAEELPPILTEDWPESDNSARVDLPFQVFLPVVARAGEDGYEHVRRVDVRFGQRPERLRLEGLALSNLEPASGEAILLLTRWRALQDIPHGLMLRLELSGPNDNWAKYQFRVGAAHVPTQGWDAGETFFERRGLVIPIGAPPGDYTLHARVFSPGGDEWLPEDGEPFEITRIRVGHSVPAAQEIEALPGREVRAAFGDTLALVGYAPWGSSFTQGNPLMFDLYWQALTFSAEDFDLGIELVNGDGTVLVEQRVQPVANWFPTSRWRAGEVLEGHYILPLPVDAPPGNYQIRLTVYTSAGAPLPVDGTRSYKVLDWWEREQKLFGTNVTLPEIKVQARPRRYRPPAMEHHLDVVLGDDVRLLGYNLATASVEPGGAVELTLYWKTLRRMEHIYAVFNHLVGPDGTLLAQTDSWAQEGTYYTNQWLPGEMIETHYTIPVPPDAPAREYMLRVGMYDAATGERLITLVDGDLVPDQYVPLTTIVVSR